MQFSRRFLVFWRRLYTNSCYSIRLLSAFIRSNVSTWSWGNIVSNLLTLGALIFSIQQNSVNDERYIQNEKDNNKELSRIRARDSLQSYRDSVQTSIFREEYKYQVSTNNENRKKDSSQLSLFSKQIELLNKSLLAQNKGLDFQNEELQVQRIANKSYLTANVTAKIDTLVGKRGYVEPVYILNNNGKSTAQNVVIKYSLVVIDSWGGVKVNCSKALDTKYSNLVISEKETVRLKTITGFSLPVGESKVREDFRLNLSRQLSNQLTEEWGKIPRNISYADQNKISKKIWNRHSFQTDSIYKKYPKWSEKYYLISQISYQDRFKGNDKIYSVNELTVREGYLIGGKQTGPTISVYPVRLKEVYRLKDCIVSNKFNYDEILATLKLQVTETENSMIF